MPYYIYIFFGLAPSIIWLLFYLRKDVHPESNRMVIKVFLYGMLSAVIAAGIEIGITKILKDLYIIDSKWVANHLILFFVLYNLLVIALIEELVKYLTVRQTVLNNPEFDEPSDIILYMIIAALGFAGLENILVLLRENFFLDTMIISVYRFIGATFLHALCSGTLGYFLALSLYETKKRKRLIITGLSIAAFLHTVFNLSIIKLGDNVLVQAGTNEVTIVNIQSLIFSIITLVVLLSGLAFFVSYGFKKVKKMRSVCKVSL